jgi:hypothetical protein
VRQEELLIEGDERLRTRLRHGRKGTVQLAGLMHVEELRLHPQPLGGLLRCSQHEGMDRIGGTPQERHPGEPGERFREHLYDFSLHLHRRAGDARNVAAGPCLAGHEALRDRIGRGPDDDGERAGRVLGGPGHGCPPRHEEIHGEAD